MVAIEHGAGLHIGEIGTSIGLGITLTPALIAAENRGKEAFALFLRTVFNQRRPKEVFAHVIDAARSLRSCVFLGPDDLLAHSGITSAELSGPTQPDPTSGAEHLFPTFTNFESEFFVAGATAPFQGREFSDEVFGQPGFGVGTEFLVGDGRDIYGKSHEPTLGPDQSSFRTRAALSWRNFGQTLSLNGTSRISVMIRCRDSPIGK